MLKIDKLDEILQEIKIMKNDLGSVKNDLGSVKNDLGSVKEKQKWIIEQQKEHSKLLRAIESAKDEHGARLDNIDHRLANIEGDMKNIKGKVDLSLDNAAQNRLEISNLKKEIR